MRRKSVGKKNMTIAKRLTAMLVAVVFVFGTAVIPAEIYGTEADTPEADYQTTEAVETAEPEEEAAGEETTAPEEDSIAPEEDATVEEPQETDADELQEAEELAAEEEEIAEEPSEEVIEELNDALTVDLDSIDESEYDGFMYELSEKKKKKEIREMEDAIDGSSTGSCTRPIPSKPSQRWLTLT